MVTSVCALFLSLEAPYYFSRQINVLLPNLMHFENSIDIKVSFLPPEPTGIFHYFNEL